MKIISHDEFLLLFDADSRSETPNLPYHSYPEFNLDEMNEDECLAELILLCLLTKALQIPPVFEFPKGSERNGIDGLCRYCSDMIHLFVKPVPVLSLITNQVFNLIYDTHGHGVLQWNYTVMRQSPKLVLYSD